MRSKALPISPDEPLVFYTAAGKGFVNVFGGNLGSEETAFVGLHQLPEFVAGIGIGKYSLPFARVMAT
jgi:hypothetical protein